MIAIAGGLLAAVGILAGALLAAAPFGLVVGGAGLVAIQGMTGTLSLCYVLVVGGVLGATGTAAYSRKAGPPPTF